MGAVNLNTWYKLSMAVHSTSIDVSVNGVPWEHTTDAQFPTGGVAIFGGENMVAHFSYVRSRQYAATVPTMTVGAVTTNGVSVASLTLNPTSCGRGHEFARDGDAKRASTDRGSDGYV